ncbi:hypothetical protein QBC39DRAFT_377281 [Podospora conica]|nr:hypothetical protein QBC39DRAFT_377281 [Schizothecium conicum]
MPSNLSPSSSYSPHPPHHLAMPSAPLFIIICIGLVTIPVTCVLVAALHARPHHPSHYVPDDMPPDGGDPTCHNGRPSHPCLWAEAFPDQRGHHGLLLGGKRSLSGVRRVSAELQEVLMERRRRFSRVSDVEGGVLEGAGEV